ncbi:DUF3135 domain-containing protein [Uliginosibacterium sp. 31-12]|uniref:DUF3135 domain-containing protein n=1 Tax=Uliginosibacterium sp. 31-12 TaxID=3062781 RepID=UPI0026E23DAC|nr:DUF3135 domain-containing protein [Uliginosibacterium sp. 31-12]MDO6387487.1 DUF3135 domain-containing protein [Uliginosibacterium sp. 31-12]
MFSGVRWYVAGFVFDFDFDHWRELAEKDPAAFFAARKALLERFIQSAPSRMDADLRSLQEMVDLSRAEAGTPDIAVGRLMGMLGDHLGALAGHMRQLRDQSDQLAALIPERD